MESAAGQAGRRRQEEGWRAIELFLLAPFAALLWFVWTEPLVLPQAPASQAAAVSAPAPETTVEQRIAPVAQLALEGAQAAAAAASNAVPEPAAAAPAAPAAVAAPSVKPAEAGVRLEIADATGVDGFASDLAAALEKGGITVVKAAGTGAQRRTVILYGEAFEGEARRLSKLFNHPPVLVAAKDGKAGLRLVLGSKAVHEKLSLAGAGAATK